MNTVGYTILWSGRNLLLLGKDLEHSMLPTVTPTEPDSLPQLRCDRSRSSRGKVFPVGFEDRS